MQCPKCGAKLPDGSTVCNICFARLDEPEPPAAPAPQQPSFLQPPAQQPAFMQPPAQQQPPYPQPAQQGGYTPGLGAPQPEPEVRPSYLSPNAPMPQAPMGGGRATLAGDVIPGAPMGAPAAPQPMPTPYGPPPGPAGRPHGGSYPLAPRREMAPAKSKGGAGAIIAIVLVLLLAGGGAAGFLWYQKQRAPIVATEKFLAALKAKDWKALVDMGDESSAPAGTDVAAAKEREIALLNMVGNMFTVQDYKVGEATVTGDTASVKVSLTVQIMGQTKSNDGELKLKLVNGQWKIAGGSNSGAMGGFGGFGGPGGPGGAGGMQPPMMAPPGMMR